MNEKFLASGVAQFFDEVCAYNNLFFEYGVLIGEDVLLFDEDIVNNVEKLHSLLRKTDLGSVSRAKKKGSVDW